MSRATVALSLLLVTLGTVGATEVPGAVLILEVYSAVLPADVPGGAPPRFVLLEDGQVFVGGTSRVETGRLERGEVKEIEKQVARVRKLQGLGASVTLGPGNRKHLLILRKGRPLEIVATGDPSVAPARLKPLAALLADLSTFQHASLRPYEPTAYLLRVREGTLVGGCRPWGFTIPLAECLAGPRTVPAEAAADWPKGAAPASVCAASKNYVVTLRPLLPGEKP